MASRSPQTSETVTRPALRAFTDAELRDVADWGPDSLYTTPADVTAPTLTTDATPLRCTGCQRLRCRGECEPGQDYGHAKGWY